MFIIFFKFENSVFELFCFFCFGFLLQELIVYVLPSLTFSIFSHILFIPFCFLIFKSFFILDTRYSIFLMALLVEFICACFLCSSVLTCKRVYSFISSVLLGYATSFMSYSDSSCLLYVTLLMPLSSFEMLPHYYFFFFFLQVW